MKNQNFFFKLRIFLFVALLSVGCVVGFLTFLRPTVSESEGRPLTTFPTFTLKSFLSKIAIKQGPDIFISYPPFQSPLTTAVRSMPHILTF